MNKIANSEIKAIMRRDAAKAEDYARRHNIEHWYTDVDELLSDPDINAIYIATPPESHADLVQKAARKGKAIYVEKPMARTYQECLEMINVCQKANVPLFVAYYRRTLPSFLKVKELIENGAIGEVRLVNIEMYKPLVPDIITHLENNWRVNPAISGGGYFHDLASHQFDFLDFLLGPIKNAVGFSANQAKTYLADDIVTASFEFESGVLGSGSWCFSADKNAEKEVTTIIGSLGKIEYKSYADYSVILDTEATGRVEYSFEMPEHIQSPLIELVVKDICGEAVCPSTGETAARTNWVMEQICK